MRRIKKFHLWLGLIFSIFILIESVTGLMLEEPQWFGGKKENIQQLDRSSFVPPNNGQSNNEQGNSQGQLGDNGNNQGQRPGNFQRFRRGGDAGGLRGVIDQLHRGQINGMDIHWVMDLTAVAMVFLSLSGIYMSIKILKAEHKGKK